MAAAPTHKAWKPEHGSTFLSLGTKLCRINLARYLFERAGEIASLIVCLARLVRHPHSLIRANEVLD
ncbi:MAG: hypothetical protein ABII13_01190 [Patescibacteria group bacterium]